jgi:Fe2+ or Zn2+ uptake regulation protein
MACGTEHHHHLICRSCGKVRDFQEDEALEKLARELERRTAFKVQGHRLEFTGVCPECQATLRV